MATVTATYLDAAGQPMAGTVYLSVWPRTAHDGSIIAEKRLYADLDENGQVSFTVTPTDDTAWAGRVLYLVEERLNQLPFRAYWIEVPTAGIDLADADHVTTGVT